MDLPDLVAKLRIDTSQLSRAAAEASVSMGRVREASDRIMAGLPDDLGKIGEEAGDKLGKGMDDRAQRIVGDVSDRLKIAFQRAGADAGGSFGDGFFYDADLRLRDAGGKLASRVDAINKNRDMRLRLDVDDREATSKLTEFQRHVDVTERRLGELGGALSRVGLFTGFAVLGQQAVTLAAALAPVVGIVGALPAAAGVAAAGISTVLVGMQNVTGSFKDGTAGAESFAKLSPAAQSAVTAIKSLTGAWASLTHAVQQQLFAGVSQQIADLARVTIPTLQTGMVGVADGLNAMAKNASTVAQTPMFQGALAQVFAGTRTAIDQMNTAVGPLMSGLANLAAVAQPVILRFTAFAAGLLKSAGLFLSSADGARKMADVMNRAADIIASVWHIAINLGKSLQSIFNAADAGRFLGMLEKLTGKLAAFTSSATGQEEIKSLFQVLGDVGARMGGTFLKLVEAALGLVNILNKMPGPMRDTVVEMAAFSLAAGPIVKGASNLSAGIKGVIDVGGKVKGLFKGAEGEAGPLSQLASKVGGIASGIATGLADMSKKAATAAADMAVAAGKVVAQWVVMATTATVNAAKVALAWTASAGSAVADAVAATAVGVAAVVAGWVTMGVAATVNALKTAFAWTLTTGAAAGEALAAMAVAVASVVGGWVLMAAEATANAIRMAAAWIIAMGPIAIVIAAVVGLVVLVVENWNTIARVTAEVWGAVVRWVKQAWDTISGAVAGGIGTVVRLVEQLPGQIRGVFTGAIGWLEGVGKDIIEGLVRGITGAAHKVKDVLTDITNKLPSWKGPAQRDKALLRPAGALLIQGLIDGIASQVPSLRTQLSGVSATIANGIGEASAFDAGAVSVRMQNAGRATAGGSMGAAAVGGGPIITNNVAITAVPYTPNQFASEVARHIQNMERAYL